MSQVKCHRSSRRTEHERASCAGTHHLPGCQCENPHDAVFCGNAECHKALGEFRYVIEELAAQSSSLERLADKVTAFTGRPHFVTIHVLWFLAWV